MANKRKRSRSQIRICQERAESLGAAAAVTGVGLFASIFGNVLQARDRNQLQAEAHRIWEERERLRAALRDWQAAHSRMEVSLRFTEASLRFLDEQNHQLKEQLMEVQRQRDEALIDNQKMRRENEELRGELKQPKKK